MIREFYEGRTLFLTGGTGFLGQGLIAKILRELPGLGRLYVLVRPKKRPDGKMLSAGERLEEELFTGSVFDRFRREAPEEFAAARLKVVAVAGDMMEKGLGLEEEVRARLCREVDLIINSAATVVFDEPLDTSLQLNTLGPLELLGFARGCRKKVDFIHVSTAYTSGRLSGSIAEKPLPLDRDIRQLIAGSAAKPFDPEREIADCQARCLAIRERAASEQMQAEFRQQILTQNPGRSLSEKRLAKLMDDRYRRWIERQLVEEGMRRAQAHGWNDVYTFTKGMGEQMLVKHHGEIPLVIVRPSIVESSLEYPEPGWIYGLKVTDPLVVAYGRGLVPDFPARADVAMDLVPVDIVVNTILAASTQASQEEVRVFHAATSSENPLTTTTMYRYIKGHFLENPMPAKDGAAPELPEWTFPSMEQFHRRLRYRYLYPLSVQQWLYERLPDRFAPAQKKRRLGALKTRLKRVLYFTEIFGPYTTLDCHFEVGNSLALYATLPPEEKRLFNMDVRRIDWQHYYQRVHLPGLRRHVLKEEPRDEVLLREAPEEVGAEEARWQVETSLETIPDLLRWAGTRYAGRTALQVEREQGWTRLSYRELLERAEGLAAYWQGEGLEKGQRLLLVASSSPEWVVAYMAATCLGAEVVPLDVQVREEELWDLVRFVGARALVAEEGVYARLGQERLAHGDELLLFAMSGLPRGRAGVVPPPPEKWKKPRIHPDDVASILFTSGPLVEPRGVLLTHRNFVSDLLALSEVQRVYETDQVLSLLPLNHALEFTGGLLMSLWGGATVTYLEALNSREILAAIRACGISVLLTVPRLLKILIDRIHRLERAGDLDSVAALTSLRLVVSGGAPLAGEIFDAYRRYGIAVHEGYGLTEAAPVVAVNPPGGVRRGSVGQALPGVEVRIGEGGEILVRGPNISAGYLGNPALSEALLDGGWLHTGDLGRLDEDGYLYIEGRCKELIVTGSGKNIYPEEVEALYRSLPQVAELSVVGVRSPRTLSEEVHGVAVLERSGDSQAQIEDLVARVLEYSYALSRRLPSYQRIQHLHIWRRPLPRHDDGRVDRSGLLAELDLERQKDAEAVEVDESLPPWERAVYRLVGRITGLGESEVAAHAEAPLDTLLDSLMAVEFAARLDLRLEELDRSTDTLRQLLVRLEPHLQERARELLDAAGEGHAYWSRLLAGDGEKGALSTGQRGLLGRLLSGPGARFWERYYALRASGLDHVPLDRPYLLAAHLSSPLDAVAIQLALRTHIDELHLVAGPDLFSAPGPGSFLLRTCVGVAGLDGQGDFVRDLLRARRLLGVRRPLLVFPEGVCSPADQLQPFKAGVGLMAFEAGVPVVPVHVASVERDPAGGRHSSLRRPVKLLCGAPVEMEPYQSRRGVLSPYEIYREIAEELRRRIALLSRQNM